MRLPPCFTISPFNRPKGRRPRRPRKPRMGPQRLEKVMGKFQPRACFIPFSTDVCDVRWIFYRCRQEDQETGYLWVVRVEVSDWKMRFALLHRNRWLFLRLSKSIAEERNKLQLFVVKAGVQSVQWVVVWTLSSVPCVMPILIAKAANPVALLYSWSWQFRFSVVVSILVSSLVHLVLCTEFFVFKRTP